MKKTMFGLEVLCDDENNILIVQDFAGNSESVVLHPNQIDVLVQWLQEAKLDALKNHKESQ